MTDNVVPKEEEIDNFISSLKGSRISTENQFNELRKLAVSKGGFINNQYRRIIYSRLFSLERSGKDSYTFFQISNESNDDTILIEEKKESIVIGKRNNYEDIIIKDTERTIFHQFNSKEDIIKIKKNVQSLLIELFSILNGKYHYYQGFHDIATYFMLIFDYDHERTVIIEFLQRLLEFFLLEYCSLVEQKHFDFSVPIDIVFHLVELKDKQLVEKLKSDLCDTYSPYFVLSWIVSWYTQSVKNNKIVYRVCDYLLCSHPIAIYHLTSEIFLDRMNYLLKENMNLSFEVYATFFQKLDFNTLDIDEIIRKTEISINTFSTDTVITPFKNKMPRTFFPFSFSNFLFLEAIVLGKRRINKRTNYFSYFNIGIIIASIAIMVTFIYRHYRNKKIGLKINI